MSATEVDNAFSYHELSPAKADLDRATRQVLGRVAHILDRTLPAGREKAVVKTKLEEAMFWAAAAIARSGE